MYVVLDTYSAISKVSRSWRFQDIHGAPASKGGQAPYENIGLTGLLHSIHAICRCVLAAHSYMLARSRMHKMALKCVKKSTQSPLGSFRRCLKLHSRLGRDSPFPHFPRCRRVPFLTTTWRPKLSFWRRGCKHEFYSVWVVFYNEEALDRYTLKSRGVSAVYVATIRPKQSWPQVAPKIYVKDKKNWTRLNISATKNLNMRKFG